MTVFIVHALAYPAENQCNHVMRPHHNRFPSLLVFDITAYFLHGIGFLFSPPMLWKERSREGKHC